MGVGLIKAVVGVALWALANGVYFDMRRKGIRGFGRFLAFWFGTPTTWATLFLVPEGRVARIKPPPDDEASLLAEVRRDRALRIASGAERAGDSDVEATEEEGA